ncbi:MAG: amylo-alpha-1,6-glucosidase [Holophagaceae bacterium]
MPRPSMEPPAGTRAVRFVGDRLRVHLGHPEPGAPGWLAFLRTTLTRAGRARAEVVALAGARPGGPATFAGSAWRDIPMARDGDGWSLDLPLTDVGFFRAKAYARDPRGRQHWPAGEDLGLAVQPDGLRSANLIYCAFPRLFGAAPPETPEAASCVEALDRAGWTVLPPSGTLRDLKARLPHVFDTLGMRILHLLPVGPVPTVYARFGRLGSPYAALDLTAVDPALAVFDGHTTAEDQFVELADAVHARGGMVLLDLVAHHTGWGSRLMAERPEWFQREADGRFRSPGAWGTVWGDLVELKDATPGYWEVLAGALRTWCRRGVDGFRADAGYMVPLPAWQFVQASVRDEFPEAVFLLEGLGGAWETTEALLTEGGMQWAYSELFQNHRGDQVSGYLDHAFRQAGRLGPLVHYAETHDNPRLAAQGRRWSLLRHRLCALASDGGAFGTTCGAEWLADEKIDVHRPTSLAWGREPNLLAELGALARLLAEHPCFLDGARCRRLSADGAPAVAFARISAEGLDRCLVLANLDPGAPARAEIPAGEAPWARGCVADLLGQPAPPCAERGGRLAFDLEPGAVHCLAERSEPRGLGGAATRRLRAQAAWAWQRLAELHPPEALGACPWTALAAFAAADPAAFLAAAATVPREALAGDPLEALRTSAASGVYRPVRIWEAADLRRVLPVPPGHWVLVQDPEPFRVEVERSGRRIHLRGVAMDQGFAAALPPSDGHRLEEVALAFHRLTGDDRRHRGVLRLLPAAPPDPSPAPGGLVLLTNGRGAYARLRSDFGAIASKYDALLAANLDAEAPCDRHVLATRARAWVNADSFLTPLDRHALAAVEPGPPARWDFRVNAGDGRQVALALEAWMEPGRNAVALRFLRPAEGAEVEVFLTVRLDLEDRGFHGETRGDAGLDAHWGSSLRILPRQAGFRFAPAADRILEARCQGGRFHLEPEWCRELPHPLEAERGQADRGDAWSPGWFELSLPPGSEARVDLAANGPARAGPPPPAPAALDFPGRLARALQDFLARRGGHRTVIAGFPWFLDWGRDAAVAARGLVAAGWRDEALDLLRLLGSLERGGSLPNQMAVDGDRGTSDAPLWFALACGEAAARFGTEVLLEAPREGRPLRDVLTSLGRGLLDGTPSGSRLDAASGLVWSPARQTWMDTDHPAWTPREGYPVELQVLAVRLFELLQGLGAPSPGEPWGERAARTRASLDAFWVEEKGWYADVLEAGPGQPAQGAKPDVRLRPNQLLGIALGLVTGSRARRAVEAATRHLVVPGGLRSLAPLAQEGPPYLGRYLGDEEGHRKPAYHNGTAWPWWLPIYAEALAAAWDFAPGAVAAARSHLADLASRMDEGCLGQLPELLDGDAPHAPRGCDAQAWSVSEALRVWVRLGTPER